MDLFLVHCQLMKKKLKKKIHYSVTQFFFVIKIKIFYTFRLKNGKQQS